MQKIKLIITVLLLSVFCVSATAKPKKAVTGKKAASNISEQEQRKLDYFFYDAVRQRHLGNYDCAVDLLTECYYINPQSAAVAHEFAIIYSDFQDTPHALAFMQQAARLDPSNIAYKKSYAELLVKNESPNDAIKVYEEIARLTGDEEIDYMLASLYKQTGNSKQSIATLNRLESKTGIDSEITMEKFGLYMHLDKKKQAFREIDHLIEKYPQNVEHRLWRGAAYMVEEKPGKALQQFEIARQIEPGNPKVAFSLFSLYAAEGDSARANQVYTNLYADSAVSLADKLSAMEMAVYYSLQNSEQMNKNYQTLTAQYPESEQLTLSYIDFLIMQENLEEATLAARQVLKINPHNCDVWHKLIALQMADVPLALDSSKMEEQKAIYDEHARRQLATSEEALQYCPDEPNLYLFKAAALQQMERTDDAFAVFQAGLERVSPANTTAQAQFYLYIGDLHAGEENLTEALANYEKAYALDESNITLLNNYAYHLALAKKDLDKAEAMSSKTVLAQPENVSFLDTYAWIFFQQGNFILADLYIKQAVEKGGNNSDVIAEHYGDIQFQLGNTDEALRWWKRSAELGNKSEVLKRKIGEGKYVEN